MLEQELNTIQLSQILEQDKETAPIFRGVFARNNLPDKNVYPSCLVVNTDSDKQPGAHWLAMYFDEHGGCEFFDSYGLAPSEYGLKSYVKRHSTSSSWNEIQFQAPESRACGYYCFIFLLCRCRKINLNKLNAKDLNMILNTLFE